MENCQESTEITGNIHVTTYTKDGIKIASRIIIYMTDCVSEHWFDADGRYHRLSGPALQTIENSQVTEELYFIHGEKQ